MMTKKTPKSIGILGTTFETPNLGVSALAAGAVRCLHKRYPEAHLFFLDYEPEVTRTVMEADGPIAVPLIQMRFSKKFWLQNNIAVLLLLAAICRLLPFKSLRAAFMKRNRVFRTICEAEMFTAVSGGDSFSDLYGLPRFLYVSLPQILALVLRKPLIQLPQTYGPFRGSFARWTAQQIVRHSERAFCRDFTSLDKMFGADTGAPRPANAAFCYDMAFGIDNITPQSIDIDGIDIAAPRSGPLVGVNVSGLLYREACSNRNSFGIRSNYRTTVLTIIDFLITAGNATVLLVPHVFDMEAESESDLEVCKEIFAELESRYKGHIGIACGSYGPNEIRSIIGHCDFFTGSRMHACIAAWSQSIPAVAIAYSDKFLGVLNTIGVDSLAADARKLSQEELLETLKRGFRTREVTAAKLRSVIPDVRMAVHQMLFDHRETPEDAAEHATAREPVAVH
ncbi:MAG TPA: polysaccharide pyruvyl transferase family protein [Terracidiphilus sp.]|nr:polysaccharide pyruvyl transferase family protein [Terracidiphilus sp.]